MNTTYPRTNSVAARYLARFLRGEQLEHRQADNNAGSYRLSGFVHYLEKKHGWKIYRTEFKDETGDPIGRQAIYTKYWLPDSEINLASSDGKEYSGIVLELESKRIAERIALTIPSAETKSNLQINLLNNSNTTADDCQGINDGKE